MKKQCMKVKALFKSGIIRVIAFLKDNRNSILKLMGKLIIEVCKIIIELLIEGRI